MKIIAIVQMLDHLRLALGRDAFDVLDHWDADLWAVGIASPSDHGRLAYIASVGDNRFYVHLETGPDPDDDLPNTDAGIHESVVVHDVIRIVRSHFEL